MSPCCGCPQGPWTLRSWLDGRPRRHLWPPIPPWPLPSCGSRRYRVGRAGPGGAPWDPESSLGHRPRQLHRTARRPSAGGQQALGPRHPSRGDTGTAGQGGTSLSQPRAAWPVPQLLQAPWGGLLQRAEPREALGGLRGGCWLREPGTDHLVSVPRLGLPEQLVPAAPSFGEARGALWALLSGARGS